MFDITTVKNTGRTHFKKGAPSAFLGRNHSEEAKKKMSEDKQGRCLNTGKTHFKKGVTPWNKGKTGVYSEERIAQLKGQCKDRLAGKRKGKAHSPEAIENIRLARKNQKNLNLSSCKGKSWTESKRESSFNRSIITALKAFLRENRLEDAYTFDWLDVRKAIYKRDAWTCQECGIKCGRSAGIACHHIDYVKSNNDQMNLITLCTSCHGKTTHKTQEIVNYYQDKILLMYQTQTT
jgi:hypothetical protein